MKKLRPFVFSLLLNKDFFISDRQPNHHRYQDSYYGKRYGSRRSWRHQNYDQGRMPKSKQSLIKNVPPFFFTFFKIIFFKLNFFIRFFYFQTRFLQDSSRQIWTDELWKIPLKCTRPLVSYSNFNVFPFKITTQANFV